MNFENTVSDLLRRGVPVRFQAKGDSMYPSIRCGEHVHVSPAEAETLRVGDVVLARARRGLTAHRVVKLHDNSVITRGDNALGRDAVLEHDAVIGRVTLVERGGAQLAVPDAPSRLWVAIRHFAHRLFSLSQPVRSHA